CQVAVLLMDASEGVTAQDVRIAGYIHERRRGAVVAVNKWDLLETDPKKAREVRQSVASTLKFMPYVPTLSLSALKGTGVSQLMSTISSVFSQYCTRVATPALNDTIARAISRHEPPVHGRGRVKIFYATQVAVQPPTFVVFANNPEAIHFSYERYLANQIREAFRLKRTPVRLVFRKRRRRNTEGSG
ncbi:MAG: GTP-binding protein, partial [Syntrophobacteria bacterium]